MKSFLKQQLKKTLPGTKAHIQLAPDERIKSLHYPPHRKDAKQSAVLVLIYPKNGNDTLVLIERASYNGVHSRQIGLPGGKKELEDKNLICTSLRETKEELGVVVEPTEVVGKLSDIYIPPSNFWVSPYVAVIDYTPDFIPDKREVNQIIEVPLKEFMLDCQIAIKPVFVHRYDKEINVKCFEIQGHTVWGATAMILAEFIAITKAFFK